MMESEIQRYQNKVMLIDSMLYDCLLQGGYDIIVVMKEDIAFTKGYYDVIGYGYWKEGGHQKSLRVLRVMHVHR
jgi:hypothetical protein